MDKLISFAIGLLVIVAMVVGISLLITVPVMLLWNAIMPELFEFARITFWQAFGLALLARLLLGTGSSGTGSGGKR